MSKFTGRKHAMRILQIKVQKEEDGMELISCLRRHGCSHSILVSMKPFPDAFTVNGACRYMKSPVREGDVITIRLRETNPSDHIEARPLPFPVLCEDEDIVAVNKPSGMAIHPTLAHPDDTLANAAAFYFRQKGEPFSFRCINRLDLDTTGVLILAKNALSASILSDSMRHREIHRTYLAVAEGILPPEGVIDQPIARKEGSAIMRCVDTERGVRAVTHYRTLGTCRDCSLLELHLETGRTHQIRVHMAAAGHPLVGDSLYNPDGMPGMSRQALHSWKLDFIHPVTKKAVHLCAPLPQDIIHFLKARL